MGSEASKHHGGPEPRPTNKPAKASGDYGGTDHVSQAWKAECRTVEAHWTEAELAHLRRVVAGFSAIDTATLSTVSLASDAFAVRDSRQPISHWDGIAY